MPGSAPERNEKPIGAVSEAGYEWLMRRNLSVSPRMVMSCFAGLVLLLLAIAVGFWWRGATLVLPFAVAELGALVAALLWQVRHANDRERIVLSDGMLAAEHRCGKSVESAKFNAAWVRVEPVMDDVSLVEISGQGARICVGRYLLPGLRRRLAAELRAALRQGRSADLAAV